MASTVSEPSARNDIELGPVTHWPTVYAAIAVGATVLLGITVVAVLAALQPAPAPTPEAVAAVVPAPPARPRGMTVKPEPPVTPVPVVEVAHEPTRDAIQIAQAAQTPPVAPVTTAVTPIIRLSDVAASFAPASIVPDPPAPAPAIPEFSVPSSLFYERTGLGYEPRLVDDLQACAKEIDLDAVPGTSAKLLGKPLDGLTSRDSRGRSRSGPAAVAEADDPVPKILANRDDLAGLPVIGLSKCRASDEDAQSLCVISGELRRFLARLDRPRPSSSSNPVSDELTRTEHDKKLADFLAGQEKWLKEEYVPALAQMLCADGPAVRLQLTAMLKQIKGPRAGAALARQALFDLSPEVREAAVIALKDRRAEQYRQTLLDGFRHPWVPVADHAAYALTTLNDQGAAKALSAMLDLPDPSAPVLNEKKKWVKAELVKVNHLRNCVLCHAPADSEKALVRGFVPKVGQPIPVVYYANPEGDFVRADVTYLRQDFSVLEGVPDPGKWPAMQRFDYLVRRRPLTDQEVIDMTDSHPAPASSYPQQEAVRFALEKLTRPDGHPIEKVGLGP